METKIKIVNARLIKEQKKYYLKIETKIEQRIDLSSEDQSYLSGVFSEIISESLECPFKIKYIENKDDVGMNEACKKFIEILDAELTSILKEAKNDLINESVSSDSKTIEQSKEYNDHNA